MIKTLKELSLNNQKVLMRVDFNVPIKEGKITDTSRIEMALSSIRYAIEQGASLILMSHLGRPKGKVDPKLSLKPCAQMLEKLLGEKVQIAPDCIGHTVQELVKNLKPKQILLLENLRFHPGEEKPDQEPGFVDELASLGDCFVNEAFATAHRKHASTYYLPELFAENKGMGFLMEKEIQTLSHLLQDPEKPFVALLGGAKISSKIKVIQRLLPLVDRLLVAGAMAFPFLQEKNIPIGDSLCEPFDLANLEKEKISLPKDFVVREKKGPADKIKTVLADQGIESGWEGVDIGPKTIEAFSEKLKSAKTVFWNGPVGVFETSPFDRGTNEIAHFLASLNATVVVGGGDSLAAIKKENLQNSFTHLSSGGGASLEFLELGTLPGIEVLNIKK